MAENSKIEWTTHTFNPWRGCTKVSEGCKNCYAEALSRRNPGVLGVWGPDGRRETAGYSQWQEPVKWNRKAGAARARVFCASLADVFEGPETMPENDGEYGGVTDTTVQNRIPLLGNSVIATARDQLFRLIDDTPNLDWLLLTKRPENVTPLYGAWLHWNRSLSRRPVEYPANVWVGASVENQRRADERLDALCAIPARVRFVSYEPALEFVDFRRWLPALHWVIIGGESGAGARPFDPEWARKVLDQCRDNGVPVFVKQMGVAPVMLSVRKKGGDLDDIPEDLRVREFPS